MADLNLSFEKDSEWFWNLIFEEEEPEELEKEEEQEEEEEKRSDVDVQQGGPGPWWHTYQPSGSGQYTQLDCRNAITQAIGQLLGEDVVELIHHLVFFTEDTIQRQKQKYVEIIGFIYSREDIIQSLQNKVFDLWRMMEREDQRFTDAGEWENVGPLLDIYNAHEVRLHEVQIQLIQAQRVLLDAHKDRQVLQRWLTAQVADFEVMHFS